MCRTSGTALLVSNLKLGSTKSELQSMALFQALPAQFDRAKYIEVASQLQIPESTADKWLTKFVANNLLIKQAHDSYSKKDS